MLKTYLDEWKAYPDLGKRTVCKVDAKKIFKKIKRHFKINAYVNFSPRMKDGYAFRNGKILIGTHPSLVIIAHELAHVLEYQKYGSTGHTKRFKKVMLKIVKYIRKKNYWENNIVYTMELGYEDKIESIILSYKLDKEANKISNII